MKQQAISILMLLLIGLGALGQTMQPKAVVLPNGGVITQDDFRNVLVGNRWTWIGKSTTIITFGKDGVVRAGSWVGKYNLEGLNTVTIRIDKPDKPVAKLQFQIGYSSYEGMVNGQVPFRGFAL